MKKRVFCLLLLMALLVSCQNGTNPIDGTDTTNMDSGISESTPLQIVENGKSDYIIVFDAQDNNAKAFATYLQTVISAKTGAILPTRAATNVSSFEKTLLIGNTGADASARLKAELGDHAFGVCRDGNSLVFCADGYMGYYEMEKYLIDTVLASAEKSTWISECNSYFGVDPISEFAIEKDSSTVYYLVYNSTDPDARAMATKVALQIKETCGISVKTGVDSSEYKNEILFGKVNRPAIQRLLRYMTEDDGYVSGVYDGAYAILSNDDLGLAFALNHLIEQVQSDSNSSMKLTAENNFRSATSLQEKNDRYADAVKLATKIYGTYSTHKDELLAGKQDVLADQALVDALIKRMGDCFAVSVGSSSVLYKGYVKKLDTVDYKKVTKLSSDQHILVATEFVNGYFGETLSADENGYVDLTAYCSQNSEYTLYYHAELGLAVMTPKNVPVFHRLTTQVNGYTNREYLARMAAFFNNPAMPEPSTNTEQSRVEIAQTEFQFEYVYDYTTEIYETFYSPAICTLERTDGQHDIYVAYEYRKVLNREGYELPITYLYKSDDGGSTWNYICKTDALCNASLFELNGKLYLLGFRNGNGNVMFTVYDPITEKAENVDLSFDAGLRAPCTVSIENGRLYCAFNDAIISASVTSDLKKSSNWTVSNNPQELLTREKFEQVTGKKTGTNNIFWMEEGNVIKGADGELYVIYRLDAMPTYGYAIIFHLSADGSTLSVVESCNSIIEFPYTQSKFTIRYDEETGKYISLTSLPTAQTAAQRNVLGLVVSDDLIHWEVVDVLLVDREMINTTVSCTAHAFQYVDFVICDGNILYAVREAIGNTNYFHDGNYITMYTLSDYAELINSHQEN